MVGIILSMILFSQAENQLKQHPELVRLVPSDIDLRYQEFSKKVLECEKKQDEPASDEENGKKANDCSEKIEKEFADKCQYTLNLFAEPSENSKKIGELKYFFCKNPHWTFVNEKKESVSFTPDINDEDWGYFGNHHTLLDKKENWFQLPKNPFPDNVWVSFQRDWKSSLDVVSIEEAGLQIESDGVLYELSELTKKEILFKKLGFDRYCGELDDTEEDPAVLKRRKRVKSAPAILRWPISRVLTKDKHWKIPVVNLRGC